jgi:chromosome segregation ATPase
VLERDVARFQERENILRQITLLEHGLVLMRYDMYKAEFEKAKEEHKTATEQYIALERESQPYLDQAAYVDVCVREMNMYV